MFTLWKIEMNIKDKLYVRKLLKEVEWYIVQMPMK